MITATIIILLVAIIIVLLAILTGSVVVLSPLLIDILALVLVIKLAFPKKRAKKIKKKVVTEQPQTTMKFCPKCGENLTKLKAIKVADKCPYCGQKMQ